jgi:putative Holliday junction resolvase
MTGSYIALDVGTRTIGVAVADTRLAMVLPDRVLARKGVARDAAVVAELCRARRAVAVVVGLPLDLEGGETRSTRLARQVGEAVEAATGLPVHWQDERYSTLEAEARLQAAGFDGRARRGVIDAHAAVVILEDWLRGRADGTAG